LVSEAERNNKSLRAKFFPAKGLKASKERDAEEKLVRVKRGLRDESSDEEEGRSALGRAKKQKIRTNLEPIKDIRMSQMSGGDSDDQGLSGLEKAKKEKIESKPDHRENTDALKDNGSNLADPIQPIKTFDQVKEGDGQIVMSGLKNGDSSKSNGKTTSGSLEDQKELKSIKKREKRKRRKLKAAELVARP
jgi:hypothetical protein